MKMTHVHLSAVTKMLTTTIFTYIKMYTAEAGASEFLSIIFKEY